MFHGRFGLDPQHLVGVEQVWDTAEIFPTPGPRPGFWPSADPLLFAGVENPSSPRGSRIHPGRGGRESIQAVRVEQILAGQGLGQTPNISRGSRNSLEWQKLARPQVPIWNSSHLGTLRFAFGTHLETCNTRDFMQIWFWAITCTIWLRFQFWRRGSAWFFGAHLLCFLSRGPNLGPWGRKIGPGWAWDLFGAKMGAQKTWFCGRMISPGEITGVPLREMDCMVPRRLLGRLFPPKPTWEISFTGISPFLGKLAWAPGPSLCISYWPYEGPIGAIPYLATRSPG